MADRAAGRKRGWCWLGKPTDQLRGPDGLLNTVAVAAGGPKNGDGRVPGPLPGINRRAKPSCTRSSRI